MTTKPPLGVDLRHHSVARELGIEIIDGTWPVAEARTIDAVQHRFSISRTVAREAARQLEAMGLVTTRRRVGLAAQPASSWHVLDPLLINWRLHSIQRADQIRSLTQLRMAIEPAAARQTALHASIHERAKLLPLSVELRRTGEAGELDDFLGLDIAFHRLILTSSGNELFAAVGDLVAVVLAGRTELGLMPSRPKPEALDGHDAVARAVYVGDADGAEAAMRAILNEVRDAFEASV